MTRLLKEIVLSVFIAALTVTTFYPRLQASPGPFMEDDSYFYAQIGYNLGTLHRSTFDGVNTTDGYHLVWAGVLGAASTVTSIFTRDKDKQLVVFLTIYLALILFTGFHFGRSWPERVLLITIGVWSAWLMESALLTLVLLALLRAEEQDSDKHDSLLYLLPFVRIDASVIAFVWLMRRTDRQARIRGTLTLAAGVMGQLVFMRLTFGHWTSVSSELKAGFAPLTNLAHNVNGRMALVAAFGALAAMSAWPDAHRKRLLWLLAGPAAFIGMHLVANGDVKSWYTTPVMACWVAVACSTRRSPRIVALVATVVALLVVDTRVRYSQETWWMARASRQFADEVRRLVWDDQELIWHSDGGGYVGYHSDRHVINGDGLMNTHEYAKRLRAGKLRDYFEQNKIRFVIINFPRPMMDVLDSYGMSAAPVVRMLAESPSCDAWGNAFWSYRLYKFEDQ